MKQFIKNKMQAMPASFLTLGLCLVLSSTLYLGQIAISFLTYANASLSLSDNLRRVKLVKQVIRSPQSIRNMNERDIAVLLNDPSLRRHEMQVSAWYYHGESCALDIYFSEGQSKPDYVEYRALSLNADVQAQYDAIDQSTVNDYCLKDILEAQGVDTPASYARQPTPTWDNPYRT